MAVEMNGYLSRVRRELRFHPVQQRFRAWLGDELVVDSERAVLVWEPRRIVASYAVPAADVLGELVEADDVPGAERPASSADGGRSLLAPSTPFGVHTCPGRSLTVRTAERELADAAFAPLDDDLAGFVVLDHEAFTRVQEEDEPVVGHPRDPFHRVDSLRSDRRVTVSLAGEVLADSTRTVFVVENPLPVRYYFPPEDVRGDLLIPTAHTSVCPYKGRAAYWSVRVGGRVEENLVWSYPEPLPDAAPVAGRLAFYTERLDLEVEVPGGERPVSRWT